MRAIEDQRPIDSAFEELTGEGALLDPEDIRAGFETGMGEARIEILYALYLEDELSTRELGEWVDREDNGLNYHLRRLRSAGLINQKRFKPEGGDYSFYELSGVGRLVVSAFLNTVEQANDVPREPSLD